MAPIGSVPKVHFASEDSWLRDVTRQYLHGGKSVSVLQIFREKKEALQRFFYCFH